MKKLYDDERLMLKVCDLYYNSNLKQEQISQKLDISRPTISRILDRAKQVGMVKIEVVSPFSNDYNDLEKILEHEFNLREVIIIDDYDDDEMQMRHLGKAAAEYLERVLSEDDIIGVSMGRTLKYISPYIEREKPSLGLTFFPLVGGMGQLVADVHCNQIVIDLSRSLGGNYYLMHAPAYILDSNLRESLRADIHIKEVFNLFDKMTVAIVGTGAPTPKSTMIKTGYYSDSDIENMKKNNIVGDICLQMYDINGKTDYDFNEFIFGARLDSLKKAKKSIAVAGDLEKVEAIYGGIAGGYINVLITNNTTANGLIKKYYERNPK